MGTQAPVITVDGPSGSGKGTVSRLVAWRLGWHFLDSGALYRLVGLAALQHGISLEDEQPLGQLAGQLDVRFESDGGVDEGRIMLEGVEVSAEIRSEQVAAAASRVAALPAVRDALLGRQRGFCRAPGLVADGRDMGTVVFPGAQLKIFLTASQQERALRRYKQLKEKGIDVNLVTLLDEIERRDARDGARQAAPLRMADDAILLDSTVIPVEQVVDRILELWQRSGLAGHHSS
ncbi:MAG: (d)CMP kinase [Gammaproteobacteria bacterium]|nr:(d)CMP kinase [Gammaproteobacteria bacterium]